MAGFSCDATNTDAKKGRYASPANLGARSPRIVIRGRRGVVHDPFVLRDGVLWARSPIGEEDEQVAGIDGPILVKVGCACCTPLCEEF